VPIRLPRTGPHCNAPHSITSPLAAQQQRFELAPVGSLFLAVVLSRSHIFSFSRLSTRSCGAHPSFSRHRLCGSWRRPSLPHRPQAIAELQNGHASLQSSSSATTPSRISATRPFSAPPRAGWQPPWPRPSGVHREAATPSMPPPPSCAPATRATFSSSSTGRLRGPRQRPTHLFCW
jgi:hypothetical protein